MDPAELNERIASVMVRAGETNEQTAEERALVDEVETGIRPKEFSITALIILVVSLGAIGIGGSIIFGDEHLKENWILFWQGQLKEELDKRHQAEMDRMEKLDRLTQNRYGDITLFYSPRDAEVKCVRLAWRESMDQFMERYEHGGADERQPSGEFELKQCYAKTAGLKGNQYFQSIPIQNLPIVERKDDGTVFTYEYKIDVTHHNEAGVQDYKPRSFLLHSPFSYHKPPPCEVPEGPQDCAKKTPICVTPLRFQETGGNAYAADFTGCDLIPEPSIFKCTYAKTMYTVKCEMKTALEEAAKIIDPETKKPKVMTEDEQRALRDSYTMQFSGQTLEDWNTRIEELQDYSKCENVTNDPTKPPNSFVQAQQIIDTCGCPPEKSLDKCEVFKIPPPEPPIPGAKTPPLPPVVKTPLNGFCQDWKEAL